MKIKQVLKELFNKDSLLQSNNIKERYDELEDYLYSLSTEIYLKYFISYCWQGIEIRRTNNDGSYTTRYIYRQLELEENTIFKPTII